MNQESDFERQLTDDLSRLGGQIRTGPTRRQLVSARHRRIGRKVAAVSLACSAGTAGMILLAMLFAGTGADEVSPSPGPSLAIEPLEASADPQRRRETIRRALEKLGVEGEIVVEKHPSGQVSFATASAQGGANRQLEAGLRTLLRNFTLARLEVSNGQMQISLLASERGQPRRSQPTGERR